jgi:hypothetical protein
MNSTRDFVRIAVLGAACAVAFGVAPGAQAGGYRHHGGWNDYYGHNRSHFSISINLANLLGNGYYHSPRYRSRDRYYNGYGNYYDGHGNYDNYYGGYDGYRRDYGYYDRYPQYSIGYTYYGGGYDHRRRRDYRDYYRWDGHRDGRHHGHDDNDRPDCDQNRTNCTGWLDHRWDENRTGARDENRTGGRDENRIDENRIDDGRHRRRW